MSEHLGGFEDLAKTSEINAHELTFNILQDYIDSMVDRRGNPSTPRTKRNYWKLINTLIQFGVKRKCMSSEILEQVRGVDLPKDNPSEITIWKPSEFEEMLKGYKAGTDSYLGAWWICRD